MKDNTPCNMTWRLVLGALLAASGSACSADELPLRNVGNTSSGLEGTTPVVLTGNARFAGRWLGLTEDPLVRDAERRPMDYAFPSGSRDVVLDLTLQGDLLEGSITFGSGVPPEPEAGVAYPPGVNYGLGALTVGVTPLEGLAYSLADVSAENFTGTPDEVVFNYQRFAGFTDWCPLQPALPTGDGGYTCVGGSSGTSGTLLADGSRQCNLFRADGSAQLMDCDYLSLCIGAGPCSCDATGCAADLTAPNRVFIQLSNGELTADFPETTVDVGGRLGSIRFQRAAD